MNELTIITPEQAFELMVATLAAIAAGGLGGAPITTTLVAIVKRAPGLENVPAPVINLTVGVVLTVAVWLAAAVGYDQQLESVFDFVVVLGPAILSLLTTVSGSHVLYQTASRSNIPVLGHSRTVARPMELRG